MSTSPESAASLAPAPLDVTFGLPLEEKRKLTFRTRFRIGRTEETEVCIPDGHVSRAHAEVVFESGQWWVKDLGSSNGIFVDGERREVVPVGKGVTIRLGIYGPHVEMAVQAPPEPAPAPKPAPGPVASETVMIRSAERYFAKPTNDDTVGDHTRMVRIAYHRRQTKQTRKFAVIIGLLALMAVGAGGYAYYVQQQAAKQRAFAQELFYSMKSLDVDIANVEKLVIAANNTQGVDQVKKYQNRRQEMEKNYDRFLSSLKVYDTKLSEQDRLVLRVSRIFGECELAMPPGFLEEVQTYIKKWQSSGRYKRAIRLAQEKGYTVQISQELLSQGLPPQFFYLAMQESDFDEYISGPMTYKGIAKGMWQFIPETAVKYGLHIGPLVDLRRPDPGDERHHYLLATKAAAKYLKELYSTDAQASGLLVMASYNWGETKVIKLIRSLPPNPKDRNYWQLLAKYKEQIPKETYDYVFYIVSAAVIGENPRLFGFDFDNPLGHLDAK